MEVGQLFARLGLDTSEYDRGLDNAESRGEQSQGRLGGLFQRTGGIIAGALSFATGGLILGGIEAIGSALGDMFSNAMEDARGTQLLNAQTEQVIRSMGNSAGVTAQHVADFAASLSDASGMSLFGDDQIQASTNMLLTFGNIKGEMLDLATTMTVDMGQALKKTPEQMAVLVGKLLNSADAMSAAQRMGVSFTDEQIRLGKAMFESGDIAGYQSMVLQELNRQFGGQAQAAAAAAGGMVQFKARMGELAENIAAQALPMLDALGSFAANTLAPALEQLVGQALDYITNVALPAFREAWASLQPVFNLVGTLFQGASQQSGGLGNALTVLGTSWTVLKTLIDAIVPPIRTLIMAAFGIVQDFLKAHGTEIKAALREAWTNIGEIIKLVVALINATIVPAFRAIAGFLSNHKTEITTLLSAAWTIIKAVIDSALAIIKGVLQAALAVIRGDWAGAWEAIKTMFSTVWSNIKIILSAAVTAIKTELSIAWDAIKGVAGSAWNNIKGTITAPFIAAKESLSNTADNIKSSLSGAWDNVKGRASSGWDNIKSEITSKFEAAKSGVSGTIDSIKNTLSTAWSGIESGARNAWNGIASAIGSAFGAVTGRINSVLNSVRNAINDAIDAFNRLSGAVGGPQIPRLASGTRFFQGGIAMVGELGPELVYLPRGSQVVPHRETARQLDAANAGPQVVNQYNLTAQYGYQSERKLRDDVRALQMLGVGGTV